MVLQSLEDVERDGGDDAEDEHGDGIDLPVMLTTLVYSRDFVHHALYRAQHWLKPGVFLLKHGDEIESHRLGDQDKDPKVNEDLCDAVKRKRHIVGPFLLGLKPSKLVGIEQGNHQIDGDTQGDEPGQEILQT